MATRYLRRYEDRDRMNHWFIALMFVLAGLSGLAFFHPSLYFFSALFGGGVWARILHPFLGIVMAISFVGLARRVWHENFIKPVDIEWLKRIKEVINNEDGPTAVEYAVMLALIVVVCIAAITTLGSNANSTFSFVGSSIKPPSSTSSSSS